MMQGPFRHEMLRYRNAGEFLAGTLPFVEQGLISEEPVLVATTPDNLERLRRALPAAASGRVALRDLSRAGRNPGRILPAVLVPFIAAHPGRRVRVVSEPVWPGRTSLEYPPCMQHEALSNVGLADRQAAVLCPYDARLGGAVLADAERTHPVLRTPDGTMPSPRYTHPLTVAAHFNMPLPSPPAAATRLAVEVVGLERVRQHILGRAEAAGLPPTRVMDAVIAVNELTSNTVEHTSGPGTVTSWVERGRLACQVTDTGHLADPMLGRLPVAPAAPDGRGLVVVQQVSDLVRIHTVPGRTTIRIHIGPEPMEVETPFAATGGVLTSGTTRER